MPNLYTRPPANKKICIFPWIRLREETEASVFRIGSGWLDSHTPWHGGCIFGKIVYQEGKEIGKMEDYIVRATAARTRIRAFACTTRYLVETAREAHNTSPVVTAALGRLLSAGAMMGTMLKGEEDLLTLQMKGDGPMAGLIVTADAKGNVKGYATVPDVILPANKKGKLDVAGALGKGTLRVIRDMGLKEPYVGQTMLQSSEIAEDLTYYFAASEQVPSSVGLGVLMEKDNTVRQAGGFIVQLMPLVEDAAVDRLEKNLAAVTSVTAMLDEGKSPEQMLEMLLEGLDCRILERSPAAFVCNCDRQRIERVLIGLGREEIRDMIEQGEEIEVNCQFCGKHYRFTIEELEALYQRSK